jgi:hypothetical protein
LAAEAKFARHENPHLIIPFQTRYQKVTTVISASLTIANSLAIVSYGNYDDLRLNLHWGWEGLIFPRASAMVSNARSNRNSGF